MGKLTREVVVVVEGDALEIEGIPESEYECDATERCRYEGMAVDPQTMQATKGDGGGCYGNSCCRVKAVPLLVPV